jgi:hypothetical protein
VLLFETQRRDISNCSVKEVGKNILSVFARMLFYCVDDVTSVLDDVMVTHSYMSDSGQCHLPETSRGRRGNESADSSASPRVLRIRKETNSLFVSVAYAKLFFFCVKGYRTLTMAKREMSAEEFEPWLIKYQQVNF